MFVTQWKITNALKERHKKRGDFFAEQVKMGPAGSKIIDALAIPITWSPVTIIGYEIKTSRQDFLSDLKFPAYMETCHLLYFVAPKGLIEKDEVPKNVGILEYNDGKLRMKKNSTFTKIEISAETLLHCIFYKMGEYQRPKIRQEHLEDIKAKVESQYYGHEIAKKIRRLEEKTNDEWCYVQKTFKEKFGFDVDMFSIFNYIDVENKKYNKAVSLLKHAVEYFADVERTKK